MGQAEDAPQLVVGWAEAVSNDDQRSRCLTGVVENVARGRFDAVSDSKPDSAEQVAVRSVMRRPYVRHAHGST